MKKAAALSVLALMLVTGCSAAIADTSPDASAPPMPSATTAAPTAGHGTEEETCLRLIGEDGASPLREAIDRVRIFDGTSGYQGSAETGRVLLGQLDAITEAAPQDMQAALTELSAPIANAIELEEGTTSFWGLNVETWQSAVADLQARCAPYDPAS